jgi:hypothetical protein
VDTCSSQFDEEWLERLAPSLLQSQAFLNNSKKPTEKSPDFFRQILALEIKPATEWGCVSNT